MGRGLGVGPTRAAAVAAAATEEVLDGVGDEAVHRLDVHGVAVSLHGLVIAGRVVSVGPNSWPPG